MNSKQVNVTIDINCDMGEGMETDEAIMSFISSANIACGYHAGDVDTMQQTIEWCLKYNVAIGAHPSFNDKENFGRREIDLDEKEIYEIVIQQLLLMNEIVGIYNAKLHHVKPHGALYNMSAKNKSIANVIARAVKDFDKNLLLYGLSGSHSIDEAKAIGLKTISEVFADRTYGDDGALTPRTQANALILNTDKAVQQCLQFVKNKTVTTISGKVLPVNVDTICIHGDGKHAVDFAKAIYNALLKEGIKIKSFK